MPRYSNSGKDNPCVKEQELSYKCLSKTGYDKEACEAYFLNYKNCKDFWYKIRCDRRSKGIYPHLPPVEEREAFKAEYIKSKLN